MWAFTSLIVLFFAILFEVLVSNDTPQLAKNHEFTKRRGCKHIDIEGRSEMLMYVNPVTKDSVLIWRKDSVQVFK